MQGAEDSEHWARQVVHPPSAAAVGAKVQPARHAERRQGISGPKISPPQRFLQRSQGLDSSRFLVYLLKNFSILVHLLKYPGLYLLKIVVCLLL
jgi:hypothetical protein